MPRLARSPENWRLIHGWLWSRVAATDPIGDRAAWCLATGNGSIGRLFTLRLLSRPQSREEERDR